MELKLENGDYVPDGKGGHVRLGGAEEVLARVLFRLTARRGSFPLLPELGSNLYQLGKENSTRRLSAARQYVAEALAEEAVTVESVALQPAEAGRIAVEVELSYEGEQLQVLLMV